MIILFGDETLFDRENIRAAPGTGVVSRVKLLVGITGFQQRHGRPAMFRVAKDQFKLLLRPYLLLPSKLS